MNKTAYLLGLSGLIPFVGLTALMYQPWAITFFLSYSAVILSFLGGIHWGVALRDEQWSNSWRLCLCMLPSLLGWLALLLPQQAALMLLLAAYALWWAYDYSQLKIKEYRQLRRCLSLVVMVCHGSWLFFGL
ncbi:DUF3429 domain-containing protein [Marinobacterium iners]|uniref:DUF3429 domain-containing protein n=1 Tax=Marinobacterium iners TaxID=48076 RepID=UPI001A8D2294|nr:DUF3429 domain-containing protein [Marinobacterium iners]QSR34598.1 DUF3429 domain-containing protein [Marinobacterium iners]